VNYSRHSRQLGTAPVEKSARIAHLRFIPNSSWSMSFAVEITWDEAW
jgi:hypothetical protein